MKGFSARINDKELHFRDNTRSFQLSALKWQANFLIFTALPTRLQIQLLFPKLLYDTSVLLHSKIMNHSVSVFLVEICKNFHDTPYKKVHNQSLNNGLVARQRKTALV